MRPTTMSVALLTLVGIANAAALQIQKRDAHRRNNRVTITDAAIKKPTEAPQVIVFVDKKGQPIRTATEVVALVPPGPPASSGAFVKPVATESPVNVKTTPLSEGPEGKPAGVHSPPPKPSLTTNRPAEGQAPQPALEPPRRPASSSPPPPPPAPSPGKAANGESGANSNVARAHGVTYAPYNKDHNCRKPADILADFRILKDTYSAVRIYGTDCGQVPAVMEAAKAAGLNVMLGLFNLNSADDDVKTLIAGVKGDWSRVQIINVGNELVNNGMASPQQVLKAVASVRAQLRAAGYDGPVTTVDTFVAVLNHPELCDESDICTINCHPFFDPNTAAADAGKFVQTQIHNVRQKLKTPQMRIVVTESGWPWQGDANQKAVPSLENQQKAVTSIKAAFDGNPGDLFVFTAFNELWKSAEQSTHFAEQFWGVGGKDSQADNRA